MEQPSPLEELRRRLALAVGENAVFDGWTRKAVDYIRSVKSHGRTAGAAAPFDVGRLLERDLQPLLMHRLRLAGGTLELRLRLDGGPESRVEVTAPGAYELTDHGRHESHRLSIDASPGLAIYSVGFAAGIPET